MFLLKEISVSLSNASPDIAYLFQHWRQSCPLFLQKRNRDEFDYRMFVRLLLLTIARFEDFLGGGIVMSNGIVRIAILIENMRIGNFHFQSMRNTNVRFR